MIYTRKAYKYLFKFWQEKGYHTADGNFKAWLEWAGAWDKSFRDAQFKEYEESKVNKLDCIPCTAPAAVPNVTFARKDWVFLGDTDVIQETREKKMYKDERTEAQQAKDYLIKSLEQAIWAKEQPLMKAFGLIVDYPQTIGDLKKAFKDGWVQLETGKRDDEQHIYCVFDYIRVSDPKIKKDKEGFDKAWKAVKAAASDVKDQIVVMGPEKGLEALNAFKAETFH